ncbi:MAG: response regulator [Desulfobacterales bacterium]|nr:response regulator [Desulfobacterales bacterium]
MSRLLIVEENIFIRESLRQILRARFPSLIIREVICNGDCLSSMGDFKPDILILGITDNGGNGLKSLEQIRKQYPSTVIILFTAYEVEEYRKAAVLRGANYLISKELWNGNEIVALINTIFTTRGSQLLILQGDPSVEEVFLEQPLERRRRGTRAKKFEREYLDHNPDRRNQNAK